MSAEPVQIGPYTVVSRLDRGGEEAVYKVRDERGRTLALKLFGRGEDDGLRAFRREALTRAIGFRHPALLRYEQAGEHEGRVFAAMELFPSTTLRTLLKSRTMPLRWTLRVVGQLADGLAYLHEQGAAHGCPSPSRVLVSTAGDVVKIAEPGMCTETRKGVIDATAAIGFAMPSRYLAPELARAQRDPDARADIYSLGVLFYQALTGKVPEGQFRLPSQESDECPPELDEIVLRCLRQEPAARYVNAKELAKAIDRVATVLPGGLADQLETLTTSARGLLGDPAGARRPWLWVAVALVAAAALVGALLIARAYLP